MSKNLCKKVFRRNGSVSEQFVVPAGVKRITALFKEKFEAETNSFAPTQAIDAFGNLWSWGPGPTGDGTATNRLSPTQLIGNVHLPMKAPWLRTDGTMVNWGSNTYGQLGDGTTTSTNILTTPLGGYKFKKVVRGLTCVGLTEDGSLYVWGRNNAGQIGDGTVLDRSSPVQVMPGTKFENFWTDKGVNYLTAGGPNTIFAKTVGGETYAWGRDGFNQGQLGTGTVGNLSTPTLVTGAIDFVKISLCSLTGSGAAIGLAKDGSAYSWGYNANGQLGDNSIVSKSTPVAVIGGYKFKDVGMGFNSAFGLTTESVLYTWGDNSQGQLGSGSIFPRSSPTQLSTIAGQIKKTYLNCQSMYAIDNRGRSFAWGFQETLYPVLGIGSNTKVSSPTVLFGIGAYPIMEEIIAENNEMVHAITKYGSRYSWGDNGGGAMGVNTVTARYNSPVLVVGPNFTGQIDNPTGGIFHKGPETKVIRHVLDVEPGQTITVGYAEYGIELPGFNISSSQFCLELEFEWVG